MNVLNTKYRGFTLVEMAVVLVIVGLLIGAGFTTLGAYLDNAKQAHTMGSLKVTKQALLNYVKVNKHMPCPDTDGDGHEDRVGALGTECSSDVGTIPYDDIGIGRAIASDDYSNLFGYGIHKEAATSAVMGLDVDVAADAAVLLGKAGSYFYSKGAPAFDLDTPPTVAIPGSLVNSYQVCKRYAANDCSGANDVEVEFIPAVIVAFNENGDGTSLSACGAGTTETRETQNCNADMTLVRGVFNEGVYDDQIVTISAYEIKEQALGDFKDPPSASTENPDDSEYAGYDVIIRGDMDSSNDLNVADGVDNAFYIDHGDATDADGNYLEEGDLNANVVFKDGNDTFHIEGDIEAGGNVKMGAGDDTVYVGQDIQDGAVVNLGDSSIVIIAGVEVVIETTDTTDGKDTLVVDGNVDDGAKIYGNDGNDVITLNGAINGLVDMGKDNDLLIINKTAATNTVVIGSTADIDGGNGADVLYVEMTGAEWDAAWSGLSSSISNFEYLSLEGESDLRVYDSSSGGFVAP
ncbi:hypothetical protein THMIRHAM_18170 [Thiomicrorhabdus immobilis]|uniref:Prepilin-type N-terminal cleavage/methylation domain-containing protein n=1 Tax=Thiomicrorhabdus immobilis TaxID=2791037 RepID=A0ABM7MF26_9GAMM|nr:prepilin-type N-terminal cleavage/methylation domain-containing protein [Thiomicrorhabdus immobilis]BCN94032.1 hypothetical protein THMIRHAM_18170 [Thiomicrorhabdus immobilis]